MITTRPTTPHNANTVPERGLFCRNDLGGGFSVGDGVSEEAVTATTDVTVMTWSAEVVR